MSIVPLLHESCEGKMRVLEVTFRGRLLLVQLCYQQYHFKCSILHPCSILNDVKHVNALKHIVFISG